MSLERVAYPSPNYSARGTDDVSLLVLHTTEGASDIASLGNWFANPANECSSHAGADDQPNRIGVYVHREHKAWTQGNANPLCVSIEMCAWTAWSAAEWAAHPVMLDNVAKWLAEESAWWAIPLVRLTPAQAQGGHTGVCMHRDLGSWGGGHVDAGDAFPFDQVLAAAGGQGVGNGSPPSPAPPAPAAGVAPPFPGTMLVDYTEGHGTRQWQAQMASRGWDIVADDLYGSGSAQVCRQFQAEKGLDVDGVVGPATWAAAWEAPIT
jgi:hypothetical protein